MNKSNQIRKASSVRIGNAIPKLQSDAEVDCEGRFELKLVITIQPEDIGTEKGAAKEVQNAFLEYAKQIQAHAEAIDWINDATVCIEEVKSEMTEWMFLDHDEV